jgi:small ligand-binding sensory domain FIST
MYKALFELSPTRADFLSRLFSRVRPDGLDRDSDVTALMDASISDPPSLMFCLADAMIALSSTLESAPGLVLCSSMHSLSFLNPRAIKLEDVRNGHGQKLQHVPFFVFVIGLSRPVPLLVIHPIVSPGILITTPVKRREELRGKVTGGEVHVR